MNGEPAALGSLRILVVDDEDFVRDVTARVLVGLGGQPPLEARNGREALTILELLAETPHVVICDLMMPDMDGVELVRHIAEKKRRPAILFMSGAQSSLRRAAEALGRAYGLRVLGSLPKPIRRDALAAALHNVSADEAAYVAPKAIKIGLDDIARGIEHHEFCYHYQPKLWMADGTVESVEALARWQHPDHGLLPPGMFIPLAESGQLIAAMTAQLVQDGLQQLAAWHAKGIHVAMAMNLSPSMLSDVTMPDRFAEATAALLLKPESVTFEITETGVAEREAIYLEIITRLQMKGFHLSIDDFGTGQSSLQKLEALPFAELKIDRQFVHGVHNNEAKRAILEASLDLAKRFGLRTVAEGVELPQDLDIIKQVGCEIVQGYLISRPCSPAAFEAWVAQYHPG